MHNAFGLVVFVATLILIWSSDRFFEFLAATRSKQDTPEQTRTADSPCLFVSLSPCLPRQTWLYSWAVAGAYLILILAQREFFGLAKSQESPSNQGLASCLDSLEADTMAARWGRWQSVGFATSQRNPGSAFGEFSKTWNYQLGQ